MKSIVLTAFLALGIVPVAAVALPCSDENAKFTPERQAEIALLLSSR
ncbi:MAG: hypothetical protein AAF919_11730 [Pseudomonadota bacterium]